jgi:non-ribosomal peptide synthetase component E (peptide arylation enzyme)
VGELAYRGPNLFPGYFRRPDVNEKSFDKEGFFFTGDNFKILDERFVSFFDRKKDIIIRGGFNISAAEIENLAQAHPRVGDAAAIAVPDEVMGEKVCLCVVAKPGEQAPGLEDLTAWMREQGVASYKLPEYLRLVDTIPRNPVGKILKRDLRQQGADGS